MVDYDSLAAMGPAADDVRHRILAQIARGRSPYDGRLPSSQEINNLAEALLPLRKIQAGIDDKEQSYEELTRQRKTSDYWHPHCETVGQMMFQLAECLHQNTELWQLAGLVHDFDFLNGPHYDPNTDPSQGHPTAVSRELLEMGAPPVLVLAVMEHSPHLQLAASSPMSHALIMCDEYATMTGAGIDPTFPASAKPLVNCLLPGQPIIGYTRDDMFQRANRASKPLIAMYQYRDSIDYSTEFDSEGWQP